MTETVRYSRIYLPDLSVGTGTGQVVLADGRVVSMDDINLDALALQLSGRSGILPIKVLGQKWYAMAGYNTLSDALLAIGSDTRTLLITTPLTIGGATSIPSNVTVCLAGEGSFTIASGAILTFASPKQLIPLTHKPLFTGAGTVSFTAVGTVSPAWWGATGDGSTDDTTALQAAITAASAGHVIIPIGTHLISTKLSVQSYTRISGHGYGSVIKKAANIDMFQLGVRTEIDNLRIDGAGASYTGRGILMTTGGGTDGRRNIHDCWIFDTESYCIEFTESGAAFQSIVAHNQMDTYNYETYAVKLPDTDANGPCTLIGNFTNGPGVNIGGAAGCNMIGNTFGQGPFSVLGPWTVPPITMNDDCFKVLAVGNTFETTQSVTLKGSRSTYTGNVFNGGYTIGADSTFIHVAGATGTAAVTAYDTDNSASVTNEIYSLEHTYTPTWTGSSSNPAIGDGTITGAWQRNGLTVTVRIYVLMGSTTTYGTGTWRWSLPTGVPTPSGVLAPSFVCGTALMTDSGGGVTYGGMAFYNGTAFEVYDAVGGGGPVTNLAPFTWASGDSMHITMTYLLQ